LLNSSFAFPLYSDSGVKQKLSLSVHNATAIALPDSFDKLLEDPSFNAVYNDPSGKYRFSLDTLRANEVFSRPWDHNYANKVVDDLDVKYLYISDRIDKRHVCNKGICVLPNFNAPGYSDSSRIAMYEDNPRLELIIRNGGSALFKVITN